MLRRCSRSAPRLLLAAGCVTVACTVAPLALGQQQAPPASALTYQTVRSRALEGNLLGDSPNRSVIVYLPPSYLTSSTRYPVVYLLHGYNETNTSWVQGAYQGMNIQSAMDALIAAGGIREMIAVMPDGRNAYGGSYYTNSPVTGGWEDFVTKDLVEYVDARYRTLAQPASRGLAGYSMGGYGAIYLGMKHPEVYSAVYGVSACCLDFVGDIEAGNPEWRTTLRLTARDQLGVLPQSGRHWTGNYPNAFVGLGAAVSPNPGRSPFLADFPFELIGGKLRRVEPIYQKWLAHFPAAMVPRYRASLLQLRGLRFVIGTRDHLAHIPLGNRALAKALTAAGVPHRFEEDDADHHSRVREWMETKVLPFFSTALAFESLPTAPRALRPSAPHRDKEAPDPRTQGGAAAG